MSTLIDSSSWVHALRRDGDPDVRRRVALLLESGEAVWCEMVRLELWNGVSGEHERKVLQAFERELPNLAIDQETWSQAVALARKARAAAITVPATDLLIFACALRHRARLEHADAHYESLARIMPT